MITLRRKLIFFSLIISFVLLTFMSVYSYVSAYISIREMAIQEMFGTLSQKADSRLEKGSWG